MSQFRTATRDAEIRAEAAGIPLDAVLPHVEAEIRSRPIRLDYKILGPNKLMEVEVVTSDEDPNFSQFRVALNVSHPLVNMLTDDVTPTQRSQFEVFMLTLANPDRRTKDERFVLDREIGVWSRRTETAGNILEKIFYPDGRPEEPDD